MKIKASLGERIFNIINVVFMICVVLIMLYPMWHVACSSLSDNNELMAHNGVLLKPLGFNIDSYKAVFSNPTIMKGYKNTLLILVGGLATNMAFTTIAAYVLSRKNAMLTGFFMKMIIFTMYFSGGLIPHYLLISRTLGMNNTLWALIIPTAVNTYNLIIMRTSFMSIPDSLSESAMLDGAGHWTIFLKIILPLSKAVLAVITLYYAVGHWNSWFTASLYLKDRQLYPLQLVLREILIQNDTASMMQGAGMQEQYSVGETIKYAVIMVATVPIFILYPFLQKYFVKGTMAGAVKG